MRRQAVTVTKLRYVLFVYVLAQRWTRTSYEHTSGQTERVQMVSLIIQQKIHFLHQEVDSAAAEPSLQTGMTLITMYDGRDSRLTAKIEY